MYFKELVIPEGVNIELAGNKARAKGSKGEIEKTLQTSKEIKIEKQDNKIKISSESERRKVKALIGTNVAYLRNMIDGVTKGYTYKLKVVYAHFPITVKVEGKKVLVQNFLGERAPRVSKIIGNVEVKVDGADITVTGIDVDDVSRTAANMEQTCRITGRDRRVFQDGCWITSKGE